MSPRRWIDLRVLVAAGILSSLAAPPAGAAVLAGTGQSADLVGYWEGTMEREGAELPVSLTFAREDGRLVGRWSAPSMRALAVPLSAVTSAGSRVRFELVGDQSSTAFEGSLTADRLAGLFSGGEGEGAFHLTRREPPPPRFREEDVTFTNGDVELSGTLLLPLESGPHSAVLFEHGSGPEGRHGSRFLAEELAARGVAALIFDKRGVGESGGDWQRATLEDLAADARAGVHFLRARSEIAPRAVGIYGHSQGGLVAPLAAAGRDEVAFLVVGATYGGPVFEQDLYRVERSLERTTFSAEEKRRTMAFYRRFVEVARSGEGIAELEADAAPLRGQPWFDWLGIPTAENWLWRFYPPVGNFNPLPTWARIGVPVLLIYGERDQLVPVETSIRRIGEALGRAGNRRWAAVILPRAAHNFTVEPGPDEGFAWREVAPGLADIVLGWVRLQADAIARAAPAQAR